jgi:hypothetical protein
MIPSRYRSPLKRHISRSVDFIHENWKRIWLVTLWLAVNIGLFVLIRVQVRAIQAPRLAFQVMGYCVCVAKGAAETIKLNMELILLPVCRNTLTALRSTALVKVPSTTTSTSTRYIALGLKPNSDSTC